MYRKHSLPLCYVLPFSPFLLSLQSLSLTNFPFVNTGVFSRRNCGDISYFDRKGSFSLPNLSGYAHFPLVRKGPFSFPNLMGSSFSICQSKSIFFV